MKLHFHDTDRDVLILTADAGLDSYATPGFAGDVKLVGVQGPLSRLLEITRLNQVFQTYPKLEDALAAFKTEEAHSA